MPEPLAVVMAAFALLSVTLLLAALIAVRRRHWIGTCAALALAFLFLALAALAATLGVATQGYRALTREVVATVVATRPTGPERFTATFTFPDGRRVSYDLTGDALYVDAHIVKWHPLANILGLHTAYQLARVSGRYDKLEDEQVKPRRMFALSPRPAEVVREGELAPPRDGGDLALPRFAPELEPRLEEHPEPGGADRVAEGLEPAVRVHGQLAVEVEGAGEHLLPRGAARGEAEVFHQDELGRREAVVDLGHRELGARILHPRLGIGIHGRGDDLGKRRVVVVGIHRPRGRARDEREGLDVEGLVRITTGVLGADDDRGG